MLLFPTGKQPKFIKDIKEIKEFPQEIAIQGKTKNLLHLNTLPDIETVWIYSVNQKEFDCIMKFINPKVLYIYEMKVDDLSALEQLENVEKLYLCWNPKAAKLWDMSKNVNLKYLSIEDFKRLERIDSIKSCFCLEELNLSGGIWNALNIDTLTPINNLYTLKKLALSNIKLKDESLEPIASLRNLEELHLSNQFPTEEFAKLSVKLPQTKCDYFQSFVHLENPIDGKDIMVIGKRKPILNSIKDSEKLRKYEKQFKTLQMKYEDN